MAWKKILNFPNTGFGIFSLAFAFVLFFSFFLGTHNSFAVSDFSVTIDQNNYASFVPYLELCGGSSGRDCADYQYLIYDPVDVSNFADNTFFHLRYLPYNLDLYFSKHISRSTFTLTSVTRLFYTDPRNFPVSDFSFNLILTNTIPSDCPVCEECQVCPAIPENPYDDKFDKIIVAIYTCGAILLTIYFFYCIYGMIIKSTGGK